MRPWASMRRVLMLRTKSTTNSHGTMKKRFLRNARIAVFSNSSRTRLIVWLLVSLAHRFYAGGLSLLPASRNKGSPVTEKCNEGASPHASASRSPIFRAALVQTSASLRPFHFRSRSRSKGGDTPQLALATPAFARRRSACVSHATAQKKQQQIQGGSTDEHKSNHCRESQWMMHGARLEVSSEVAVPPRHGPANPFH